MTSGERIKKRYGATGDGRISECRAKPENVGKGRCYHVIHFRSFEDDSEKLRIVAEGIAIKKRLNGEELALSKGFKESVDKKVSKKMKKGSRFSLREGGKGLTREELIKQSELISKDITEDEWKAVVEYELIFEEVGEKEIGSRRRELRDSAEEKIFKKITSEEASSLREYLGKNADLRALSEIIAKGGGAMSSQYTHPDYESSLRMFMTRVDNDMREKKKLISSIIFFGGRCCYCNKELNVVENSPFGASGEHLTPIRSESLGATRFGNMALSCRGCNTERGNEEMIDWIAKTSRISNSQKPRSLARIMAFRDFSAYSEYDPEIVRKILEVNEDFVKYKKSLSNLPKKKRLPLLKERFTLDLGRINMIIKQIHLP